MVRKARNGIVYPYRVERQKRLANGTVKIYASYEFKVDGKTYSCKKYVDANKRLTELLQERARFGSANNSSITLGAYAEQWLERRQRDADPKTFANYRTIVRKHLLPYHRQKMASLTSGACDRIVNGLRITKKVNGKEQRVKASLSLRKQVHTTLNQICKSAVSDRILPTNPMGGVPTPKDKDISLVDSRKNEANERTAFTVDEAKRILKAANDLGVRNAAKEWFRLCTGMRPGEILGASIQDLELGQMNGVPYGEYAVNWKLEELKKEHGCGNPDKHGVYPCGYKRGAACPQWRWRIPDGFDMIELTGRWCLTPPKSKRGRKVPIIPALAQTLEAYLEATDDIPNPYGLLFRHDDGTPIEPEEDLENFRQLLENAGVPNAEHRSRHETRHTVVTILMSMGVDYGLVEEIVGHSSRLMVEHYRHAGLKERLSAMETMNKPLQLDSYKLGDNEG
ncbi:tyrosine-type recombinase/integrase [Bifidobacterium pseudocatenulatum]|jgi:integrase|uniref:tyrosine-type recombinase/integrase n=1 Tax=Bifidobacterium pseudocatenulatum TaxID=28026 RepID=UPI001CFE694B|nr:tyrosine-type recombinase/integrase [Bifidobacterium pseudocatenulatum]MCB4912607.1 tyrosine-type recombinase/integrase [Bifidobacterium pseudocatenulatum]